MTVNGDDQERIRELLAEADGYAVLDRERKRIGAFVELAGDRIVIRHDGVLVWRRRRLPITAVASVIPDRQAVVLGIDEQALAETETPPSAEPRSDIAEEQPAPDDVWQDRINRYIAPVEDSADQSAPSRDGTENQPSPSVSDARPIVGDKEQPLAGRDRADPNSAERHLLFISTSAGYSLVEREGPPPPLGHRLDVDEQAVSFVVLKLGSSPLPNDHRICAYLEPTE